MITRDRGGELGARNAEVRRNIEDPAQLHSMVTGSGDASVLNRFQEGFSRQPITHGQVRSHGQFGVPDVLGRHVSAHLIGQQPDVVSCPDQFDHRQIDRDEVREVVEPEKPSEIVGVARHLSRVPLRELGDDARRGGAHVMHMQFSLGQTCDERIETAHGCVSKRRAEASCCAIRRRARSTGSIRTVPRATYRTADSGESVGTFATSRSAICSMWAR
jgi:hypothetical protein